MRTVFLPILFLLLVVSCKKKDPAETHSESNTLALDTTSFAGFYQKHPDFAPFRSEISALYRKHEAHYIWYDRNGRIDFAEVLYNAATQIGAEGLPAKLPYAAEFATLFDKDQRKGKPNPEDELLISSLYFFYTKNVLEGLDTADRQKTGWYLPRDKTSYVDYLDELMRDPDKIKKDESEQLGQYYNLKKALKKYRAIRDKGGWAKMTLPAGKKELKPGDRDPVIVLVRKRLALSGDLAKDNGSDAFDDELADAIAKYDERQARDPDKTITAELLKELSIPVEERIKTIIVNMERCRWIAPEILEAKEVVAVNIPSFRMAYLREGKPVLTSRVVVGKELNKTVVFSGQMSYLVFSPYWNVPKSIIEKEIKPAMDADPDYLEKHDMEWNGGNVRQKPGQDNSLGLVKFMFPNNNNIYLHDTPAKSLFGRDKRALSHGCVRVEKARDLAVKILENDKNWTPAKIDAAMKGGKEKYYTLDHKIPVYIAYFTAWADADGNVAFFPDVYSRDNRLAGLLYNAD